MPFTLKKSPFFFCVFFLLVCSFDYSYAEDPIPKPSELTKNWWSYFSGEENTGRINPFLEDLQKQVDLLSLENKEQAQGLIKQIALHFEEYKQIAAPLPLTQSLQPLIKNHYTIFELVELWKQKQILLSALKSQSSQQNILDLQEKTIEEELLSYQNAYQKSPLNSEEQFLKSLYLINSQILLEINAISKERAFRQQKALEQELNFLEEEIDLAKQRLFPSDRPDLDYYKKIDQLEGSLRSLTDKIAQKRIDKAKNLTSAKSDEQEQELNSLEIEKALLDLQYIQERYMLYIERALKNDLASKEQMNLFFQEAKKLQNSLDLKIDEWSARANNAVQMISSQASNGDGETIKSVAKESLIKIEQIKNENLKVLFLENIYQSFDPVQTQSLLSALGKIGSFFHYLSSRIVFYSQKELFRIGSNSVTLINIFYFFAILLGTFWLSRIFLNTLSQIAVSRKGVKRSLVYSITRLIHYLFLGIGIAIALSALGFDFSNLVLLAGALGIGLGFGLQSIFNNFISGIIILFENHLKVGDYIELDSGLRGEIREINVRSTIITDNDGIDILIPNAEIVGQRVLNWTMKIPYRRYHIPFRVAYGTDKDLVAKVVKESALNVSHTLVKIGIPEPTVRITKLAEGAMEFELVVWVNEKYTKRAKKVLSDYLWAIETALTKENITIPFPKYDVNLLDEKTLQKDKKKSKTR